MELNAYAKERLEEARKTYEKWREFYKSEYGEEAADINDNVLVGIALDYYSDRLKHSIRRKQQGAIRGTPEGLMYGRY